MSRCAVVCVLLALTAGPIVHARPTVRNVRTNAEFTKILKHHKEKTGLPVVVDYYSDGCGPCRQIAPLYKQLGKQYKGKVVFLKVDVNFNRETSSIQAIRSMPTFQFYFNGKKVHQFSGGDVNSLNHWTEKLAKESEKYDVELSRETLVKFYEEHSPENAGDSTKIDGIMEKIGEGGGPAHYKLIKKLIKKYGSAPETTPATNRLEKSKAGKKDDSKKTTGDESAKQQATSGPSLETASLEDLKAEIQRREEAEAEKKFEDADDDDELDAESTIKMYQPSDFPERITIIGSGPAGLAAAIYAARAGLRPVVVAPPVGGQLQGKGVMVENYPGVHGSMGPAIVGDMVNQAALYGATFEQSMVDEIDVSVRPFKVKTNTTTITTHSIVIATGADSVWLDVEGENDYRGGGVSTCATCDGFLYRDQEVVVIGGGDTAMEDALVLARTSSKVTVVHRRDSFRASHVLGQRVLQNDKIEVRWNATVTKFEGEEVTVPTGDDDDATAETQSVLTKVHLTSADGQGTDTIACAAAFVAIGHSPNTAFLRQVVDMDAHGYIQTRERSTYTSVDGVFAAGDVADKVYRQAVTSAGSGAMAALDAERWLSEMGIGDEAAEFEAELMREMMEEAAAEAAQTEQEAYPEAYKEAKREEAATPKTALKEAPATPTTSSSEGAEEPEEIEIDADADEQGHTEL